MTESRDRIKRRVIALQDTARQTRDMAVNILSGSEGVKDVKPARRGVRVVYRLRQTGIKELLAELHSKQVLESRHALSRLRFALVSFLEQQERDNLLARDGWWHRVQAIHIACQADHHGPEKNSQDRRHWQHYTDKNRR